MLRTVDTPAFPATEPCLIRGCTKLSIEENLRVPVQQELTLSSCIKDNDFNDSIEWQNGYMFPGAVGSIVTTTVTFVSQKTCQEPQNVKKLKREIQLELDENDAKSLAMLDKYDAGDSFYLIFPNPSAEVDVILERLELMDVADHELHYVANGKEEFFSYFPNPCSCRYLLTYCLDIRRSPGRPLLRILAQFCSDKMEERRLLELCSTQGGSEFNAFVRQTGLSFVDLLLAFPSCKPSITCLMELLPRLLPRAYSVSNYKFGEWKNRLRFVYSLLKIEPKQNGIQFPRYGVCSGWLKTLKVGDTVKVILKEPSKFRLPPILNPDLNITKCSLVLVAPGTGITPFISFLHKIAHIMRNEDEIKSTTRRYLFYGSSDLTEEFLFEDELNVLKKEGILTDLVLCESRRVYDQPRPKYVYDALKAHGAMVAEHLANTNVEYPTLLYSCGDVKNMSKELWACLSDIIVEHLGLNRIEAIEFLQRLRKEERLIEDVWS